MKPDKVSSIFWAAISAVLMYSSYKLKLGNLAHPGPGFLPFLAGLGLFILSIIVFLRAGISDRGKTKGIKELWEGTNWSKTVIVAASLLFYALIFARLGFLLSTSLLLIFLLRAIEPVKWFAAVGGAIIASFVSFAVFALWLQVQLPRGIIERFCF
jgi:putative tricarboxylic transport membrane protein